MLDGQTVGPSEEGLEDGAAVGAAVGDTDGS